MNSSEQKHQEIGGGREGKVGEKLEEIQSAEHFLSNSSFTSNINVEKKKANEELTKTQSAVRNIINFVLSFLLFVAISFLLMLMALISVFIPSNRKYIYWICWTLLACSCIVYTYITFFFIGAGNQLVDRLYLDGIFFIFSQLFVFSYIKITYDKEYCTNFEKMLVTFAKIDDNALPHFRQDYNIKDISVADKKDSKYAYLQAEYFSRKVESSDNIIPIFQSFTQLDIMNSMNPVHFSILVFIILLKLVGIFWYIYVHSSYAINTMDILNMTLVIFVYIQTTYSLLRVFGSYDLRRKQQQMKYLIEIIDFQSKDLEQEYKNKLDITNPQCLEAFDNARKIILEKEKEFLYQLDYSYIGLIFYYIFVIIICASYYFELEWLIRKDSPLLDPIQVIISTGNFVFLSAFLMFRFSYGTDFNNTFQDLDIAIDFVLDATGDLITMYNTFFSQQSQKQDIFEKFSTYGLLVKKIKAMSRYYIKQKISYSGKVYEKQKKHALRKEILLNMKTSLKKVKKSAITDYKVHKYLFMGFVEVDVNSFLFTLFLAVASTLPTLVPKFIQFYQINQPNQVN